MDLADILPLAIKASVALTVASLGLPAAPGDRAFLFCLYPIVATIVAIPHLAWRKRQRLAVASHVGSAR